MKYKQRQLDQRDYAVYRGDEFVDLGTLSYLSKVLNRSRKSLQGLMAPSIKKRITGQRNGIIIFRIEESDED